MRLAHKRKVQMKLQKRIKAVVGQKPVAPVKTDSLSKPVRKVEAVKAVEAAPAEEKVKAVTVALTPKQQQVLDIVLSKPEGINPKGIGLEAGQEDTKAASWATGALKKLLEENLVVKEQLTGNKVIYKAL